jgi:U32 family peptidase
VLARELNLNEVGEIAVAVPEMELEIFVHGAMCMAYSGRCYLSAFRNQRSANEGDCTQACRWEYLLSESTRPNDPLILEEDERYSYILSSKDLCLIEYLPEIMAAGVVSLKIEGRMKSTHYVAVVARTYRWAIDHFMQHPGNYQCKPQWLTELDSISNRGYTTGFSFTEEKINETSPEIKYIQTHELAATVLHYDRERKRVLVGVRNHLNAGDEVQLLLPDDTIKIDTRLMTDADGKHRHEANNGDQVYLPFNQEAPVGAVIRKKVT